MADRDPDNPMQPPRKTRDVMKGAGRAPAPDIPDAPEDPATDKATSAVENDQASA
ncbi:hypothetical protein ACFOMD_04350 [Sphingoaurantiacus capsulatus]|uniref:Uncharacterized protein n=1 Tax=Sphingoaurantiacus capsulatus TaxID=1771310 RepID=A0ABV7X9M2_9SPHN